MGVGVGFPQRAPIAIDHLLVTSSRDHIFGGCDSWSGRAGTNTWSVILVVDPNNPPLEMMLCRDTHNEFTLIEVAREANEGYFVRNDESRVDLLAFVLV
jgi:hypothetical protein